MRTLDEILEGVTAGGQWEAYTQTLSKGASKGQKRLAGFRAGTPQRAVMHANWTLSEGDVWEAWISCKEPDYLYAQRACRNFPALVRALESHLRSSEEFSRHAMYPYPDCSEQKKLEFIRADIKMKESSRQAHAALAEALKD